MIVIGLGTVWILDGLEVTIVGNISGQLGKPGSGIHITQGQITGFGAAMYVAGACVGRAVLRLADRPVRPQEAVHDHPGRLPGRHRDDRAVVRALVVLPVPVPDRLRHRRRVRGDQLRDRRADPEPAPRHDRHRHQRHLLGRRGGRRAADRAGHQRPAGRTSAGGCASASASCSAWSSCWSGATCRRARGGCSSTATPARPRSWSTASRSRSSADTGDAAAPSRSQSITIRQRKIDRVRHDRQDDVHAVPAAHHRSGFSLFIGQAFLYNAITFGYAQILATFFHVKTNPGYYFAVIAVGNLLGPLLLGRLFDTRRPQADDRGHLHRCPACCCCSPPTCSSQGLLSAVTHDRLLVRSCCSSPRPAPARPT